MPGEQVGSCKSWLLTREKNVGTKKTCVCYVMITQLYSKS